MTGTGTRQPVEGEVQVEGAEQPVPPTALDLSPEALHHRMEEGNLYLAPKARMPWRDVDVYLTPEGRAVFADGKPLFLRPGQPGAEEAEPIAQTVFRRCGCREEDGELSARCVEHTSAV